MLLLRIIALVAVAKLKYTFVWVTSSLFIQDDDSLLILVPPITRQLTLIATCIFFIKPSILLTLRYELDLFFI